MMTVSVVGLIVFVIFVSMLVGLFFYNAGWARGYQHGEHDTIKNLKTEKEEAKR